MLESKPFYILGAGASFGVIPTTKAMGIGIKREYARCGVFSLERITSDLHKRVLGNPVKCDWGDLLSQYIPLGTLKLITQHELNLPDIRLAPPNYKFFDLVRPTTIFNFNLDGLASRFCSKLHRVLEPHGRVDQPFLEQSRYERLRDYTAEFDIELPFLTPKLLPSPEPRQIVSGEPYQVAARLFHRATAVVIVGYSFGRFSGQLDDSASWDFVIELLKRFPKPVFIVSPFPEELTLMFQQALSSDDVTGVPAFWETMASVFLKATNENRGTALQYLGLDLRHWIYEYDRAVDHRS